MRIAIAIVLALIAIGAGAVWGIGQFGAASTVETVARPPMVRAPQIAAAAAPAIPAPSKQRAQPAPAASDDAQPPAAKPVAPEATSPAPESAFRSTLSEQGAPSASAPAPAPTSDPAPSPPASFAEADLRVAPQQASPPPAAAPGGIESQFKARRVTYNRPPEKLALAKPVDVSLVVNATDDEAAGREALDGFKGEIVERDVELSDTVSAQLTGVGFDITSQTVERQRLSGKTVNRWQWRVTPTEPGKHTLILEIFGYATGSLDAEPLDAYRDVITVEVEQIDQLVTWAKGVQPLFAVLAAIAAMGSAIFAYLRLREEKKQTRATLTPPEA